MCGIIGVVGSADVVGEIYEGMLSIQHRGQDAAGIVTYDNEFFHLKKGKGLVRDLFGEEIFTEFKGKMGLGHVRYPTIGNARDEDAQPFVVNSPFGIAMIHNGNVTNYAKLKNDIFEKDLRHLNSTCDVEVILNIFADELNTLLKQGMSKFDKEIMFRAIEGVYKRVKGSYSVLAIVAGIGFVAFRDPYGIKPLIMGQKKDEANGEASYCFASESVALDILGYKNKENIKPGEAVFIDKGMNISKKVMANKKHTPCIFEFIYFARPDSFIDRISVYKTRLRLGEALAKNIQKEGIMPDVVIPVPETAKPSAVSMAFKMNVPYREGFVKNIYIGRTFIMPGQKRRTTSIRRKLNTIRLEFRGKDVLIVDDSIVRGNTSKKIIQLAKDAGAKKVYFASCSPPIKYPCVYGIDMSTKSEFIARDRSVEEIKKEIGADYLLYQELDDVIESAKKGNPEIEDFCVACFNGKYPTGDVTLEMFDAIEKDRNGANGKQI